MVLMMSFEYWDPACLKPVSVTRTGRDLTNSGGTIIIQFTQQAWSPHEVPETVPEARRSNTRPWPQEVCSLMEETLSKATTAGLEIFPGCSG